MCIENNKEIIRHVLLDYDAVRILKEGGYTKSPYHSLSYLDHCSMGNNSLEQFSQIQRSLAKGFPDFKYTIEDMIAESDKVSVRYRLDGTNLGEFLGIPPTGRRVYIKNQGIFLIKDGKLQESWHVSDMLDFMQQIRILL